MTGNKWYSYPKADYRRDKPRRDVPLTIIVTLYMLAIGLSVIILVRP